MDTINVSKKCSFMIHDHVISSPIGNIKVAACQEGLHTVSLDAKMNDGNFSPNVNNKVMIQSKYDNDTLVQPCKDAVNYLQTYFFNPQKTYELKHPKLCSSLIDNRFRSKVWQKLQSDVKSGDTITYKGLATLLENPKAARAVGSAMKNNPICILVPCHRVVRQDGIGLYAGGQKQKVKKWLLEHERNNMTK